MTLLLVFTACYVVDGSIDTPVDPADATPVIFEVPQGASARTVGPLLVQQGLIADEAAWRWYLRSRSAGACLKAGRFRLTRAMSMPELMEVMCGAPLPNDEPFTVVEGWRALEIDAALAEKGWIEAGAYLRAAGTPSAFQLPFEVDGLKTLEGFLYPETYNVDPTRFSVEGFVQRQLDTFAERFLAQAPAGFGGRGLYPVVIMASMLEREEPRPSNRPMVAGILWKRLDNGWNLGVDATSRYTLADWNNREQFLGRLRDPKDPYNTRLRGGLPPTPIGNPSLESLQAAMAPVDSEFWYYLHDADGNLHPSRNVREHEAFRRQYNVY